VVAGCAAVVVLFVALCLQGDALVLGLVLKQNAFVQVLDS
jgi:hypothetical protein